MNSVELVPNSERIAELWARIKAELGTKLDGGDIAADEEVAEMLDEVFGTSGGGPPGGGAGNWENFYTKMEELENGL